jgi:hypothetical protein
MGSKPETGDSGEMTNDVFRVPCFDLTNGFVLRASCFVFRVPCFDLTNGFETGDWRLGRDGK